MSGLNRRDFLKALGVGGGASVASACGFDKNTYRTPIEQILPYVVRPDQVIPGNPTFFATTVGTGPHAHPVLARHRDGRVVNVGANFRAPRAPAVPKAAFFELQRHYSPDRIKAPLLEGKPITWEDGLQRLSSAISVANAANRKVAYLGPLRNGAFAQLVSDFTRGEAIFWEPLAREAEAKAAELLFEKPVLPAYDLSKAHYVLSFGADFLGTWGGVSTESQFADARNPNKANFIVRFGLISPHRGQTGANADDWFAVKPGSETLVALAVARLVKERTGYAGPLAGVVETVDVDAAASASGISRADLETIAAQFSAGPAVALPGGIVGASRAATDLALATYVLNLVSQNGGVTFGLGPVYAGPMNDLSRIEQLIADMNAGNVAVLLLDDHVNPVYALPASTGFREALAKVELVVSVSSHSDETHALAKLVLPSADAFEDWGDEEPEQGFHLLRQPTMSPLLGTDVRSLGDILLVTARSAGINPPVECEKCPLPPPFDAPNWREYVKARWQTTVFPLAGSTSTFEDWWIKALEDGFVQFSTPLAVPETVNTQLSFHPEGAFDGQGDYFLIAYPHPFRYDGRYANEPWAQEIADPMTGHVWDTWVEVHPSTADKLGLADNALVEITTTSGRKLEIGVERHRGVREDTIAIAFGNGHDGSAGRYAEGVGKNVVSLLEVVKDSAGAFAWQSQRVSLRSTGRTAALVSTFGSDSDERRKIGAVADARPLAESGDSPASHPGELTGIHPPEYSEELVAENPSAKDFYGLTDHPTYRFAMTVDVNACNGCGSCAIACYAENNLPVVGKEKIREGREMAWLRIDRFWSEEDGNPAEIRFVPMLCQHCNHAPCESVCPVLATYHTIDGLNAMIYNRCVGTRYCANNCPYKVRRFNWHSYVWPEPLNFQLNPDVATRTAGIMEKCTFCVQRIRGLKSVYKNEEGFTSVVPDEALRQLPACVEACPSQALTFGNLNDPESVPSRTRKSARSYLVFEDQNTVSSINYLAKATFHKA